MSRLFDAYRATHEQGFLPIFVRDDFDSKVLVEGCLEAGIKVLEYTLRREDAHEMIPWIRKNYPEVYLLAGSTLDSEKMVKQLRRKRPQLRTVAELDDMDVDGFVAMIGWTEESIRTYSPRRLVMPTASTVNEVFLQVNAGAHFAKLNGTQLDLVSRCRMSAAHDYAPLFVTGGMTTERIPLAVEAGAVAFAAGFDLMLKDKPRDIAPKEVAEALKPYLTVTSEARAKKWPALGEAIGGDRDAWLDALPHYHPF